tara:strand:- start:169 stop:795 length:627 start_codon:yes stop_codon:yes gene_type:complete
MNISQFLLIDSAFVITAIPILLYPKVKNKKPLLLRSATKEGLFGEDSIKLPSKEKLLELERIAISNGSGIAFDSLIGDWKFLSIWKKEIKKEDSFFSSLLRVFKANLEIKEVISTDNQVKFSIITSIEFGVLSIEFSGSSYLKGKQPFLYFFFNLIDLKAGSSILLSKTLKEPIEKEKSFFALIASDKNGMWLSARGQGGALFLWLKD